MNYSVAQDSRPSKLYVAKINQNIKFVHTKKSMSHIKPINAEKISLRIPSLH